MRIGLLIYGSLDLLTGGFIYDRNLVMYLREKGHNVEIFTLPWRFYAGQLAENRNKALIDKIRAADLDLLIQDELCHPSLFLLNKKIKKVVKGPLVSIVHHLRSSEAHPTPLSCLYRAVEKQYLATIDAWVFNSQTTRQSVEQLRDDVDTYVVAYPSGSRFKGLQPEQISRRTLQSRPLQILFVGSLIRRKGLHTLIEALAIMREQGGKGAAAQLSIVGNMSAKPFYTSAIQDQIAKYGLEENITLMGALSDEALAEQLTVADLLAVPSQYEGFGIVYLEGMAFGLPAVATSSGAAHEIITPGEDGFLVPAGDPAALGDLLLSLHLNRSQLKTMSLAARARFEAHPTWAETAARIEVFLTTLTSEIAKANIDKDYQ